MDIIYNNNDKNISTDINYKNFNEFIFSNDIKIIGKLFHRNNFFNLVKDLPGDIVEVGVFKGSGVASFVKMLEIYNNNSIKKVIGFDIFNPKNANNILDSYDKVDKNTTNIVYSRVNELDRTLENVNNNLQKMGIKDKYLLIEGDVASTLPKFIEENNPHQIISFAMRDLSTGILYKQLGFTKVKETSPSYWYIEKNSLIRKHRYGFRKDLLVAAGSNKKLTEFEIMNLLPYHRIWDSGQLLFEYLIKK